MHSPRPDSSEYAALVEFIATGGRYRESLGPDADVDAIVAHALSRRARSMAQAVMAVAAARSRRGGHRGAASGG